MQSTIHLFDRLPHVESEPSPARGWIRPARSTPLIGVVRNPRSHRNKGPLPAWADLANVMVETPAKRSDLREALARFAERRIDYLAIDGGDGTVRDVLTCGAGLFGECWPAIILLPKGKTNALAHDIGLPKDWSMANALAAIAGGNTVTRMPMVVKQQNDNAARVYGFVIGGGAFTTAISLGQDVHRWGAFNSLAVGLTTAWSLVQAAFGPAHNTWRRSVPMRLRRGDGRPVEHSRTGPEHERYFFFASTLETLPAGMRPFEGVSEGPIRGMLLDTSKRNLLAKLPALVLGKQPRHAAEKGLHLFGSDAFDFEIGDRFILDGEAFPAGSYHLGLGPKLRFVVP